jgi:hypothetical protein
MGFAPGLQPFRAEAWPLSSSSLINALVTAPAFTGFYGIEYALHHGGLDGVRLRRRLPARMRIAYWPASRPFKGGAG